MRRPWQWSVLAAALALAACGGSGIRVEQIQTAPPEQLKTMEATLRARTEAAPGDLEAAHGLALVLLREARPAEAETYAVRAASGDPFYGPYMTTLGEAYLAQQKRFRALTALSQAIQLDKGLLPAYVLLAVTQEQLGDIKNATTTLNAALLREPRYFPARYHKARLLFVAEDLNGAAAEIEKALKVRPEDHDAILLNIRIVKAQGRFTLAEYLLNHALAAAPKDVDLLYELVDLAYQRQEWDRAREVLQRIADVGGLQPRDQLLQIGMSQAQGHTAAAMEQLQRLRKAYPNYLPAMEVEAGMSVLNGKPEDALAQLTLAAETAPLSAEGNFWRAVALYQLGRPYLADQALAEALRRDPGNPRIRVLQVRRLIQQRRVTEASPLLNAYLREFPADGQAVLLAVDLSTLQGDYAGALRRLELLSADPDPAPQIFARARIAYLSGNPGDAASLLRPLLARAQPSWRWGYLRAAALQRLARYGEAMDTLKPFLAAPNPEASIYRLMAQTQILAGDPTRARATLEAGLKAYPRDVGLIESFTRLAMDAEQWSEARDWLETGAGLTSPYRALLLERLTTVYVNLKSPQLAQRTWLRYLEETDPLKQEAYAEPENNVLYGNMAPAVGLTILPPPSVNP